MRASKRIGLLGGSFNPAHAGHLHISREALKRLGLDEIWWLVAPANPLKPAGELADHATRLASARAVARDPRIHVHELDAGPYTIDALRHLKRHYPHVRFVWLMGADNLREFHRWRRWRDIAHAVPIAVLDRLPYAFAGLAGRFARRFRAARLSARDARKLADSQAPAWVYLPIPRSPLSATALRKTLGENAFLGHTSKE
ncbi:MAG: nicotinate-nucleotide adenylyltransferase [Alphaproteobacteria bacterium]